MKEVAKVIISISGGVTRYGFETKDGHILSFDEMTRLNQVKAVNAFAEGFIKYHNEMKKGN